MHFFGKLQLKCDATNDFGLNKISVVASIFNKFCFIDYEMIIYTVSVLFSSDWSLTVDINKQQIDCSIKVIKQVQSKQATFHCGFGLSCSIPCRYSCLTGEGEEEKGVD